ncbi:type VII secretion protein EccB [Gulosibacter bifidus]|uniref:Type VII secretion protein EccB n=1 Tax=Gulosibacter bifidus TaxID=272239 RepID=A0ABW5RJE2_9MICO|nr:type VII secretion protein EccB [Gulosibacter bifidus]
MATSKDILDAQRFNKRRLISAFTSGKPGGREVELKSPMGPMLVGAVLTLLILVGAWIFGRFAPALPSNWQNGMFITDSDTGAQFFSIDGTLHPVRNAVSAQLLAEGVTVSRTSVGSSALTDIPRGPEVGIVGAPDSVPKPDSLANTGWAACPAEGGEHLTIGGKPQPTGGVNGSLVSNNERTYLVADGRRYEILEGDLALVRLAFGWDAAEITPVSSNWLDLFEEGERISPWSLDGATDTPVGMTGALSSAKIGTMVEVLDGRTSRYYLVTGKDTLDSMTDFERSMYSTSTGPNTGDNVIRASVGDVSGLKVSPDSPGPSSWPRQVPLLNEEGTIPCAILRGDEKGVRTEVAQATRPEGPGIVIAGGSGALVRATGGGSIGALFVITDVGMAFGLEGAPEDIVQRLGYQMTDITDVPSPWVKLLPQGPTLSTTAAWASVPTGDMAADGQVAVAAPYAASNQTASLNQPAALAQTASLPLGPKSREAEAEAGEQCERGNPQYLPQTPTAFTQLGIDRAQQLALGEGVTVAVVDSGVDSRNKHLNGVQGGHDFTGAGNGLQDDEGHGTAVAGIIAAQPVDGSGLVGVAPKAKILPVRVYQSTQDNKMVGPNIPMTADGIRWAADHGAQVIVAALSTSTDDPKLAEAVAYAQGKGSLVVASAGNRNTADEDDKADGVRYPAGYDGVVSVTAVTDDGQPTDAAIHGVHVGVAAPGQNVLVSWFNDGDCIIAPDAPSTSFSTAYVAGVAALVASEYPDESPEMWKWRIEVSALRPSIAEHNELTGWGIVSPFDALTVTPDSAYQGPLVPGGERRPENAQAGRTPPQAEEKPLLVRHQAAIGITGVGALGVVVLWLLRRGVDLRNRRAR